MLWYGVKGFSEVETAQGWLQTGFIQTSKPSIFNHAFIFLVFLFACLLGLCFVINETEQYKCDFGVKWKKVP